MVHADGVMDAVMSTISPYGGTVHIVSRGHGPDDRMARMWEAAQAGSEFHPVFAPWWMRPDRDDDWYRQLEESGEFTPLGLRYYAPVTPEDALAGEGENVFVPLESWDRLADGKGPIVDRTPAVMALDAGVSSDCFAVVVVTRYDDAPETDVDVRAVRIWRPEGGQVNFSEVEQWVRDYCREHNVVVCTYDPHELHDMAQRLTHDQVTWMDPFPQTEQRLRADAMLRNMIMQGRLHHSGDPALREHIANARAKTYGEEDDSRIRIIKGSPEKKVDGAVASSMATYQCMRLNLA
ncbi:MAG: terminase TerL endonuclease subunit [Myxococcota bacterium]